MSDQPQDHGEHSHVHPTPTGEVEATHESQGHGHGHGHGHDHNHNHDDNHNHGHAHGRRRVIGFIAGLFSPHSHDAADSIDSALTAIAEGIRALKISLIGLAVTAAIQVVIVLVSGSVALLADTIHNFSDALTAIPLGIAFLIGRRPPTQRYTYGYGRAEGPSGHLRERHHEFGHIATTTASTAGP